MKLTIVYDNEAIREDLKADWGFSGYLQTNETSLLFDTGANGRILLHNMEKLGINPASINEVFISHSHWDHTGGLSDLLRMNERAKVYVPSSFAARAKEVISIKEPRQIHENIFSTGERRGIEQSLVVKTEKGLVVIAGCSHPGVGNILKAASQFGRYPPTTYIYALIGGLHGFREFELLDDLELVCPCHCTQFKSEIKSRYPGKCIDCGAGKIITV
jgi:7,8-dihydropterin-6-yl-methyl-4-(beta-D-ribofuranosyl)aminobenzene 5'-phosphate synthase